MGPVAEVVAGRVTALIGHSGVGKSTLVNRLVPDADRETGVVSGVGKGRHTSTQSVALRLPENTGWIVDTPGIRSFGLAHIKPDQVIEVFEDLSEVIEACPRGCTHSGPPADPECALDTLTGECPTGRRGQDAARGTAQQQRREPGAAPPCLPRQCQIGGMIRGQPGS